MKNLILALDFVPREKDLDPLFCGIVFLTGLIGMLIIFWLSARKYKYHDEE